VQLRMKSASYARLGLPKPREGGAEAAEIIMENSLHNLAKIVTAV
jgi:hypothetical protein